MTDLSVVDPGAGFAPCPFAKKAFKDNKLKIIECGDDLWKEVAKQSKDFDSRYSVVICTQEEPNQTYEQVESACIVQKLSELDDASQKLEKMGYYENYEPEDYVKLILNRRYEYRRQQNAGC